MFSFRSVNSSAIIQSQPTQFRHDVTFSLFTRKPVVDASRPDVVIEKPVVPKLKWGEPIWNMFHVMAHKIMPEHFFRMRTEVFEMIRAVCYNLPCPDCANHARNYIGKINFNSITKPEHLKELFFMFHNTVNGRKHFPVFPRDKLDAQYEPMDIRTVVSVFLMHFRDKHKSVRMLADDLFRTKLANKIEKWFAENMHCFQL